MPLYEYRCQKCGDHVEALQKISDKPLKRCTKCSGKLEKQISRTSFHLKGGGWFDQGYSNASTGGDPAKPAKSAKSEKSGSSDKSKGSDGKSGSSDGGSSSPKKASAASA